MKTIDTSVPLCVDLDNTLVRTNTLIETMVSVVRKHPSAILLIPFWALRGQAYLWSQLVRRAKPDAALLPYCEPVLDFIRTQADAGRKIILATGAHELVAQDVAKHVGFFTGVFASDGTEHLVSRRKAELLAGKFGEKGFDYAGDSVKDMPVFRHCRQAFVVSPSGGLVERVKRESIPAQWIPNGSWWQRLVSLARAMRPKQWAKNVLVFVPAVLGHRYTDQGVLTASAITFVLLCFASSAVYIVNDIFDVEADRRHSTKRRRPFARGALAIEWGFVASVVLAALSVGLGWLVSPVVCGLLALYIGGVLLYSVWLKKLLIIDMVLLAFFYVFRVYLGAAATHIRITSWTALFCLFIFSGLAALKRYAEIHNRSSVDNRRAYRTEDAMPLLSVGTSCFMGAIISLGLYLGSDDVAPLYRRPDLLWLLCPVLLGWTSRLWILALRGELYDEDPVAFALRDRWSHGAGVLCVLIFALSL